MPTQRLDRWTLLVSTGWGLTRKGFYKAAGNLSPSARARRFSAPQGHSPAHDAVVHARADAEIIPASGGNC